MDYIIEGIISGIQQTSLLEWVAVTTGIMSVWFSSKENILVYPTGIISVLIYVYLAYQYLLYADMGVNGYYFIMSVYGWYHWTQTDDADKNQIPVSTNSRQEHIISLGILVISFSILAFALQNFTNSDVPYWDATTTCFAILGMWLMARKKLESWIAWIITNIISIPLYFYKGLVLTSFQFLIFTAIAILGYFAWKRSLEKEEQVELKTA